MVPTVPGPRGDARVPAEAFPAMPETEVRILLASREQTRQVLLPRFLRGLDTTQLQHVVRLVMDEWARRSPQQ